MDEKAIRGNTNATTSGVLVRTPRLSHNVHRQLRFPCCLNTQERKSAKPDGTRMTVQPQFTTVLVKSGLRFL